jgi:ribonuclease HII
MNKQIKLLEDFGDYEYVAGLDEVGRGCGAGPVVTAAVIMPKGFKSPLIRDSKKLSPKQRNEAYQLIMDNAIAISCQAGSVSDIDEIGINPTTFKTMVKNIDEISEILSKTYSIGETVWDQEKQLNQLNPNREPLKIEAILVDGTEWIKDSDIKVTLVPKGDDTYTCIAAAAIVAKVRRDEYMCKLHEIHPEYNWCKNKGYLTPDHIEALKNHGSNKYHRKQYVKNFVKNLVD